MTTLRNHKKAAGLSLIEVLIALAIFVVGILAVLRVFPQSLGIITTNRDRATALRLANARLEELRADEARLPDAILAAGLPTDTNPASPGFGYLRLAAGVENVRPYDFGTFGGSDPWEDVNDPQATYRYGPAAERLVVGERVLVPRSATSGPQPSHTLFGPIAVDGQPLVAVFREFRPVDSVDLRVTRGGGGAFWDRPVFAFMDGGTDSFTRQPAADRLLFELDSDARQFIIRYAYNDGGRTLWTQVPAGASALAGVSGTPGSLYQEIRLAHSQVVPGSVSVRQPLTQGGGRFSYDASDAHLGVLRIAPTMAGETVQLEYVVADWRLLRETVNLNFDDAGNIIPVPGGAVVNGNELQLREGDLEYLHAPVLVLTQTGAQVPIDPGAWSPELAAAGRIPLNLATGIGGLSNGSYEVNVFYRRAGNWAVATSIAPRSYLLASDAAGLAPGGLAANYPVQSQIVEVLPTATSTGLYLDLAFRGSEAGRNVLVSYRAAGVVGPELVSGEPLVVPPQSNATAVDGTPRHVVRARRPLPVAAAADPRPYILTIEGVGLNVRVVFDDQNTVRPGVPTVPGFTGPADSRQRLYELNWLVRRHR
ncbi:MAG TPA: hypothetical protein DCZ72_13820 [Armatimonadetes bacterium]|nr:hypothetical protein [Armatimonadota bacterium]